MAEKKKKNQTPFALRAIQWFFPKFEKIAPSLAHRYFIHLFYTPFRFNLPDKEKKFMESASKFDFMVDDKRIQGYRWGTSGPRIFMIHGWAGRAGQFRGIIPEFIKAGFQITAIDGPAHGLSEGKQTNPADFAAAFRKVFDIDGTPAGVIAHSFGGVAVFYAMTEGLPVSRLITISSPTIAEQIIVNYRALLNASEAAGQAFRAHMIKDWNRTFEDVSSIYMIRRVKNPPALLLIQDEHDAEVAVENALKMKEEFPAAEIHITSGLGHTRILREPSVIALCVDFMRKEVPRR